MFLLIKFIQFQILSYEIQFLYLEFGCPVKKGLFCRKYFRGLYFTFYILHMAERAEGERK